MDSVEVEKVQHAWLPLREDLEGSGILWLEHVCEVPALKTALGPAAIEAMKKNVTILQAAVEAANTVDTIVQVLDDMASLGPYLKKLGIQYAQAGVHPHHFDTIQASLLSLIAEANGGSMDPDSLQACREAFVLVRDAMLPTMAQVHKEREVIDTLLRSWRVVEEQAEEYGVIMFGKMFELEPRLVGVFGVAGIASPASSPKMKAHAALVFKSIGDAVKGMKNAESLISMLRKVGAQHAKVDLRPESWATFAKALLYTLELAMGTSWTEGMRQGWTQMFSTLRSVIEPAATAAAAASTASHAVQPQAHNSASPRSGANAAGQPHEAQPARTLMESGSAKNVQKIPRDQEAAPPGSDLRRIQLVQATWQIIKRNLEECGVVLFLKFFENAPAALQLFSFKDDEDLGTSLALKAHASRVMHAIERVVDQLNDLQSLDPVLLKLGATHAKHGVQPEHFPIFGKALLWTLEQELGVVWIPEVRDSWTWVYAIMQKVMQPALTSAGTSSSKIETESSAARQVRLVRESWRVVEMDLDALAVKFFIRIFEIAPGALQLFTIFSDTADLERDPKLQAHATKFMRTIGTTVAGLDDVQNLIPVLQSLGVAHSKVGVQPQHFPIFGQALLWTLEKGLGKIWTAEVRDAWAQAYLTIQGVMEKELIAPENVQIERTESEELRQIRLVQQSWALLEKDLHDNGVKFFMHLFENNPQLLPLFSFRDAKDLSKAPGLAKHAHDVMRTVGQAVAGFKDVKSLVPVLQSLGGVHAKYGVQPEFFEPVGRSLLWTLEHVLGPEIWTTEVESAWVKTFTAIRSVMEASLVAAQTNHHTGERQMQLLQESWALVEKDLDALAIKFFKLVFKIAPEMLQLFSFRDALILEEDPRLQKHAKMVLQTIGSVVSGLGDVKKLIRFLHDLGKVHYQHKVQSEHFPVLGHALLRTLEKGLGDKWTPELKESWAKAFATLQSVMEPALLEAKQEEAEAKKRAEDAADLRKRLVQESWKLVEKDMDAHGIVLFTRIFEIAPGALQLFNFKDSADFQNDPRMHKHARAVMETVGTAVAGLSDLPALVPVLTQLGAAHAQYGVQPEHFPVVGQALLWTLEKGLGKIWTAEVRDAWSSTFATLQSVMEPALVTAQHGLAEKKKQEAETKTRAEDAADLRKRLVQESWKLVERDIDFHGIVLFTRIFEIAPGALQLFNFKDSADFQNDPRMHKHARAVMETVGTAVAGLSDLPALVPVLEQLGAAHAQYGVQPEHFPVVGQALLWTLEKGLGKIWTAEVRDAWSSTFATLQSVMEPRLVAARQEAEILKRTEDAAERRKRLVQESWKLVERDMDAHGIVLFTRIFEIAPGALQLFNFKDSSDFQNDPRMHKHARAVMETVGTAVAGLSDLPALVPVLTQLGAAHAQYGVQPEHFPVVGQALLWTLEKGLGKIWTAEVRDAWSSTFATLQSVMEPALVTAQHGLAEKKKQEAETKTRAEDAADLRKRLVQESWKLVERDMDAHGIVLFTRIFEIAPGALQLFNFKDSSDFQNDPRMHKHARAVMETVGTAVAGLSDLPALVPVLEQLGAAHAQYGVQPEHFPVVGQALLWTLEKGLGKIWTAEVRDAWSSTFATLQSVMEPRLVAARQEAEILKRTEDAAERRKRLVQESWKLVERDMDAHGIVLFTRIFEIAPGALQLFNFKDSSDFQNDPRMHKHARAVMETVGTAVAGLSDLPALVPVLTQLGAAHAQYGVQPEHFPVVGQALLWTLEKGLGKIWTAEVRDAWSSTFATLQSAMEPALVIAQHGLAEKKKQEAETKKRAQDAAERRKRLVQESWKLVERDIDFHGIVLFTRIFEIAPGALQLFNFKDSADFQNDPRMHKHARAVMETVGTAVAGLSDLPALVPVLEQLGAAHAQYGVQPEHFPVVGQALLWTLEKGLGKIWTAEVRDAWSSTFTAVQVVMEPALLKASVEASQKASTGIAHRAPIEFTNSPQPSPKPLDPTSLGKGFSGLSDGWSSGTGTDSSKSKTPKTPMTARDKEDRAKEMKVLVQESWRYIEKDVDRLALRFMKRIFRKTPELLKMFPSFQGVPDLVQSQQFKNHAIKVMQAIGKAVMDLSNVKAMVHSLRALGASHAALGVKSQHFYVFGKALLSTVEEGMGEAWNHDYKKAWKKTFATIQSLMEPAMIEAARRNDKAGPDKAGDGSSARKPDALQASALGSPGEGRKVSSSPKRRDSPLRRELEHLVPEGQRGSSKSLTAGSETSQAERERMKQLVRDSWETVQDDLEDVGMKVFMRMFKMNPKILRFFSFKDDEALTRIIRLKTHALVVMKVIQKLVDCLDDMAMVVPMLQDLGKIHSGKSITAEHMDIFGKALVLTLHQQMTDDWTIDIQHAWIAALDDVRDIFLGEIESERQQEAEDAPAAHANSNSDVVSPAQAGDSETNT